MVLSENKREKINELRNQGFSDSDIHKLTNVSIKTINKYYPKPKQEDRIQGQNPSPANDYRPVTIGQNSLYRTGTYNDPDYSSYTYTAGSTPDPLYAEHQKRLKLEEDQKRENAKHQEENRKKDQEISDLKQMANEKQQVNEALENLVDKYEEATKTKNQKILDQARELFEKKFELSSAINQLEVSKKDHLNQLLNKKNQESKDTNKSQSPASQHPMVPDAQQPSSSQNFEKFIEETVRQKFNVTEKQSVKPPENIINPDSEKSNIDESAESVSDSKLRDIGLGILKGIPPAIQVCKDIQNYWRTGVYHCSLSGIHDRRTGTNETIRSDEQKRKQISN